MFAFMSKEHYTEYRKNWKKRYKELTQEIRDLKYQRNIFHKTFNELSILNPTWQYYVNKLNKETNQKLLDNKKYQNINLKYKLKYSDIRLLERRSEAIHMLEGLKIAKAEYKKSLSLLNN